VSRSASPPTSIISNLQVTESAAAGFSYQWTPKLALSGNIATSYSSSAATPVGTSSLLSALTQNERTVGGGLALSYAITPFLGSQLSYQYTKSVQSNLTTNTSTILLALNFNPF
jgi:long-subunit fatty acid transport protein